MSMAKFKIMAIGLSITLGTAAFGQGAATPVAPANPAATAPAGPVPTKIGVVNIQQAIGECAEGKKEIDADVLDELEYALITADIGVKTTQEILEQIRLRVDRSRDVRFVKRGN